MPDTVAQSTSNSISGSGDSTRQRWRGSERLEKWSRTEADGDRLDMLGSESSKPPMNHILSAGAAPVNLKRLPWVAHHARFSGVGRSGRAHVIRAEFSGPVPARRGARRQNIA